jgi:hypothetical protein
MPDLDEAIERIARICNEAMVSDEGYDSEDAWSRGRWQGRHDLAAEIEAVTRDAAASQVKQNAESLNSGEAKEALGQVGGEARPEGEACRRCGSENPPWFAPSPVWNAVMRNGSIENPDDWGGIVCATCFTVLAEEKDIASLWRLIPERVEVELETVTPSGRVWDEGSFKWIDGEARPEREANPAVNGGRVVESLPASRSYPEGEK